VLRDGVASRAMILRQALAFVGVRGVRVQRRGNREQSDRAQEQQDTERAKPLDGARQSSRPVGRLGVAAEVADRSSGHSVIISCRFDQVVPAKAGTHATPVKGGGGRKF
jgi:hypothetical protein